MSFTKAAYHESRSNSRCVGTYGNNQASEATPLLARFPPPDEDERNYTIPIIFSLLFGLLMVGVVIGIYLLILQSNAENVLPPVDAPPLELVSRKQWDPDSGYARQILMGTMTTFVAENVILIQTDTRECSCYDCCVQLLNEIKVNGTRGFYDIQYNFMVAEYGEVFEGLGWWQSSALFAEYPHALVIAVIGNYEHVPPTRLQIQQSQNVIDESLSMSRLDPAYILLGRSLKVYPTHLFKSVNKLPHWSPGFTY